MVTSTTDNINYKNTHINDIKLCLLIIFYIVIKLGWVYESFRLPVKRPVQNRSKIVRKLSVTKHEVTGEHSTISCGRILLNWSSQRSGKCFIVKSVLKIACSEHNIINSFSYASLGYDFD